MKARLIARGAMLLAVVAALVACGGAIDGGSAVLSVSIDDIALPLSVGQAVALAATVDVTGSASTGVVWSSADASVAVTDVAGVLTAVDVGEAMIVATSAADPNVSDSVVVTVVDDGSAMLLRFDTTLAPGTSVTLPLRGSVDVTISWGDDSKASASEAGDYSHTFAGDGSYTVAIEGSLEQYGTGLELAYGEVFPTAEKLRVVASWGDLGLVSLAGAFFGASSLTSVPESLPGTVTDLTRTFRGATGFNQDICGWDVSNVTTLRDTFMFAESFDQDIGGWNVSNVASLMQTFFGAVAFNQDIGDWNVSNVTSMWSTFASAQAFDRNISGWDVSRVVNMFQMFSGAGAFDQDLSVWDVSNVTDMQAMFRFAESFNQDLSSWCVVEVTEEPWGFAEGATAWTLPKPQWGSCPGR